MRAADRLRDWFDASADDAQPTDACPPADVLCAGAGGDLTGERLDRLVDHLAACPSCDEDWKLAVELYAGVPDARRTRMPVWLTIAAAAAIVAAVVVGSRRQSGVVPGGGGPVYRAATGESIEALVPDGSAVAAGDVRLRWSALASGTRYNVEIATEDLTIVDRADGLTRNEYRVPAVKTRTLASGTKLEWQVRAVTPEGRQVRSRTFLLVVQ